MPDKKVWTFNELREILGCPRAVEFRLRYDGQIKDDRYKRKECLEAVFARELLPKKESEK